MRPRRLLASVFLRLCQLYLQNRYGVNLHFSDAHQSYLTQYMYLTRSTDKKPEEEIDRDLYRSPNHPGGEEFQRSIDLSLQTENARKRRWELDGDGNPKGKKFKFCELVDEVAKEGIRTVGKLWETARLRRTQGDPRMFEWCGTQRNLKEALKKAHDGLTASSLTPGGPHEPLSTAPFPIEAFNVPAEVRQWMAGGPNGYAEKTLVLYGEGRTGKTEFLKAACVAMKRNYYFTSVIDQLRFAFIKAEEAVLLDEKDFRKEGCDWVKIFTDIANDRCVRTRFDYA